MQVMTEVVTMQLAVEMTKEQFVSIVNGLEKDFHSKQPGFIDSELIYDEKTNTWVMIQHWETMEGLKAASRRIFTDSAAEPFVKSLDPKSVKMTIAPQLGAWK